jgi:site-specific recombinase XerD
LISRGVSPCTINATMTALRFFFGVTVRRFDIANHIPLVPQPRKLPEILSPEEVARLSENLNSSGLMPRRKRGLHSNTLSARLSSVDGMVSPSTLAALRLMISS